MTAFLLPATRTARYALRSLPIEQFLPTSTREARRFFSAVSHNMAQEYKLKGVSSLALQPGEKHEVEVEGLDAKVLLLNAAGTVQAIGPRCTHYGAPLAKGVLGTNGKLTCPWHGGELPCNAGCCWLPRR